MAFNINNPVNSAHGNTNQYKLNNLVNILGEIKKAAQNAINLPPPVFVPPRPSLQSGLDFLDQNNQVYAKIEYVEEKTPKTTLNDLIEDKLQNINHQISQFAVTQLSKKDEDIVEDAMQEIDARLNADSSSTTTMTSQEESPPSNPVSEKESDEAFIKRVSQEVEDHFKNGGTAEELRKKGEDKLRHSFTELVALRVEGAKRKEKNLPKALKNFALFVPTTDASSYLEAQDSFLSLLIQLSDESFGPTLTKELKENAETRRQLQIQLIENQIHRHHKDFPFFYFPHGTCLLHARFNSENPEAEAFSNAAHALLYLFSSNNTSKSFSKDLKTFMENWQAYDRQFTDNYLKAGKAVLRNL